MEIKPVSELVKNTGINILIFGESGAGKTRLLTSLKGKTLILSAEAGLLSIADSTDVYAVEVKTVAELFEVYSLLLENKDGFNNLCIDSISEISEVLLSSELEKTRDNRQSYQTVQKSMMDMLRAFRDLSKINVVMTAKIERDKDEVSGRMLYRPSMVGKKLPENLPYIFDEVFVLRNELVEDQIKRYLQTSSDGQFVAKDRSGKLDLYEPADLDAVINKIRATKKPKETKETKGE